MKKLLKLSYPLFVCWLAVVTVVVAAAAQDILSDEEIWTLEQIRSGRVADFDHKYLDPLGGLSMQTGSERRLRHTFIINMMNGEYSLPSKVRTISINGAIITENVDLGSVHLDRRLEITHSEFEGDVDFTDVISDYTVDLAGSEFQKTLSFFGSKINGELWLTEIRCNASITLQAAEVREMVLLDKANVKNVDAKFLRSPGVHLVKTFANGQFDGDGIQTGLLNFDEATFEDVNLRGAVLSDALSMTGVTVPGILRLTEAKLTSLVVGRGRFGGNQKPRMGPITAIGAIFSGNIRIDDGAMTSMNLSGAVIIGSVDIVASDFADGKVVTTDGATIGRIALIESKFGYLTLRYARISTFLYVDRSSAKQIDMRNITVGELNIAPAEPSVGIFAEFCHVEGNLSLSGGHYSYIDLSDCKIGGALIVGAGKVGVSWPSGGGHLDLVGASASTLQDRIDAWPASLDLSGFHYQALGTFGPLLRTPDGKITEVSEVDNFIDRQSNWYIQWLSRQDYFSPQPYLQLISVLRASGKNSQADDIGYEGARRREINSKGLARVFLFVSRITSGYGFRYDYGIIWAVFFTVMGAVVLKCCSRNPRLPGIYLKSVKFAVVWYLVSSLNEFIPTIGLRPKEPIAKMNGVGELYFVVHRASGFVFSASIVASIAGLTQVH